MSVIGSRVKLIVGMVWVVFATVNTVLMYRLPGEETIPYHLVWASFALLYGLWPWSKVLTRSMFVLITVATGVPLVQHAYSLIIGWSECSEILLMGVILALLMWHVDRQWAARARLIELQAEERRQTEQREIATKFGSHEVRTRLTIARGYAEMIGDTAGDPQIQADAAIVVSELKKASTLATNILTFVRFAQPSPSSPVDVDELIKVILRRWTVTANRDWSADSTVGTVFGESERLEAAMDCLLENAVKFTDNDDSISVEARTVDESIVISVRDSGFGMPEHDLARVFDLFETGSSAGDRAGSGIGLAVVRAIADARGGSVRVESTVGVGTCFTLSVPLTRPDANRRPAMTAVATPTLASAS